MLLVHFQTEIGAPFCHLHNDTFVIFTAHFGCVHRRKMPMQKLAHSTVSEKLELTKFLWGQVGGNRPHNFLAVGAIAPMDLVPMTSSEMLAQYYNCMNEALRNREWSSIYADCPSSS